MRIETVCSNCNKEVIKYSRNKKIHNYFCSIKCKSEFLHKKTYTKLRCDYCNKEYEELKCVLKHHKKHYCSRECSNKELTYEKLIVICDECGKKFKKHKCYQNRSKNNFCSKTCYNKYRHKEISYTNFYRTLAFSRYKHECSNCGWDKYIEVLQVHHIDENHYNNDINNLIILCPICHNIITVGWGYLDNRELKYRNERKISKKSKKGVLLIKDMKKRISDLKKEDLEKYGLYAKMARKWNMSVVNSRHYILKIKKYLNDGLSFDDIVQLKIKQNNNMKVS